MTKKKQTVTDMLNFYYFTDVEIHDAYISTHTFYQRRWEGYNYKREIKLPNLH